jgi:hypothetical protein
MTDQTVVRVETAALAAAGRAVTLEHPPHWHLEARSVTAALLSVIAAVFAYFIWNERDPDSWVNIGYVACVSLMVAAAGIAVTRRVLAPVVATGFMIAIVVIVSAEKLRLMHMAIHAYDVVYYLMSPANCSRISRCLWWSCLPLLAHSAQLHITATALIQSACIALRHCPAWPCLPA